jgi:phage baseplate assembly protein W
MGAAESTFWQAKAGAIGETVFGLDDLDQSIRTVIQTPPGSVPLEPCFGCALIAHLDLPAPQAAPAMMRAIAKALARWEPRIELGAIGIRSGTAGHALHISVSWRPKGAEAYVRTEMAWA